MSTEAANPSLRRTGAVSRALRSPAAVVFAVAAVVLVAATSMRGSFIVVDTIVTGSTWALIAVGLALVFGVMNILNFAQGSFFMVGTLASYLAYTEIGASAGLGVVSELRPLLAIGFALVIGFALGVLIDVAVFRTLRRRGDERWMMHTFVITIGISIVLVSLHQLIWGPNTKGIQRYWDGSPISFAGATINWDQLTTVVISLVAITALALVLKLTNVGRAIRAVAQDERGAAMSGIDISRIHTLTFGISTALAAVAGAALLFIYPSSPAVGEQPLAIAFTVVILAGLGNVVGAIAACFVVALLQTVSDSVLGATWESVVTFGLIVAILVVRPQGLFGRQVRGVWEQ